MSNQDCIEFSDTERLQRRNDDMPAHIKSSGRVAARIHKERKSVGHLHNDGVAMAHCQKGEYQSAGSRRRKLTRGRYRNQAEKRKT